MEHSSCRRAPGWRRNALTAGRPLDPTRFADGWPCLPASRLRGCREDRRCRERFRHRRATRWLRLRGGDRKRNHPLGRGPAGSGARRHAGRGAPIPGPIVPSAQRRPSPWVAKGIVHAASPARLPVIEAKRSRTQRLVAYLSGWGLDIAAGQGTYIAGVGHRQCRREFRPTSPSAGAGS